MAYDRSLLFGYALDEVDLLKADYRRRIRGEFDPLEPGGRLPIDREPRAIGRGYGPHAGGFHPGVDFATDPGTPVYAVASGAVSAIDEVDGLVSLTIARCELDVVYVFRPGDEGRLVLGDRIAAERNWAPSVRKANRQMVICISRSARRTGMSIRCGT